MSYGPFVLLKIIFIVDESRPFIDCIELLFSCYYDLYHHFCQYVQCILIENYPSPLFKKEQEAQWACIFHLVSSFTTSYQNLIKLQSPLISIRLRKQFLIKHVVKTFILKLY